LRDLRIAEVTELDSEKVRIASETLDMGITELLELKVEKERIQ